MEIKVPYSSGSLSFSIPDKHVAAVLAPNDVPLQDEPNLICHALQHPHGGPSFAEFLEEAENLLVLVNDGTRPTPTSKILDEIADSLAARSAQFMVATGTHRAPTEEEYRFIFGDHYDRFADCILSHDSKHDEMTYLGTSKNGTEMHINAKALQADRILIIGSVEPHYFAGYTGGRKSILPGIAAYKTIEQNHSHAMNPDAAALVLAGNPVHDDMEDAMNTLDCSTIFSIQTVLDRHRNIYAVTAGDIHESFNAAIEAAHEVFCVEVEEKVDIVVAVAPPPLDLNLYQSQKALENGKLVLKPGGILILVSSCHNGIGGNTFYQLLSSDSEPANILKTIENGYKLGYHKAAKIIAFLEHSELWAVTDLEPEQLEAIFLQPKSGLQEAVDEALRLKGSDARVLVFPEGSITVPRLRD